MFDPVPSRARVVRRALVAVVAGGVLAGGLAACGKVDAKVDARTAWTNLEQAKVASMTMRLDDPKGELRAAMGEDAPTPEEWSRLTKASLRVVVDPAGDRSLAQAQTAGPTPTDAAGLAAAMKDAGAAEIAVISDGADAAVLRIVAGKVFLKVDPAGLERLTGEKVDLGELAEGDGMQSVGKAVEALQAGRWVGLDLAKVFANPTVAEALKNGGLGAAAGSAPDASLLTRFALDLRQALAGQVSSVEKVEGDRVRIDLAVKVRDALDAVLEIAQKPAYTSLWSSALAQAGAIGAPATEPGEDPLAELRRQISAMPDVTARATAFVEDEHLRQVRVDLASLMSAVPGNKVTSAGLVMDVDDAAPAVVAPPAGDVESVDDLVSSMLESMSGALAGGLAGSGADSGSGSSDAAPLTADEIKKLATSMQVSEAQIRTMLKSGGLSPADARALLALGS